VLIRKFALSRPTYILVFRTVEKKATMGNAEKSREALEKCVVHRQFLMVSAPSTL
jgi:hypothetical protein